MLENPHLKAPVAVSLGAIAGGLCRFYLGQWVINTWQSEFPLATFGVNISGCFLMGFITTAITRRLSLKPELFLLIGTGFLGSYTTFSTYGLDISRLLHQMQFQAALWYWLGSPFLGLISLAAGIGTAAIAVPKQARGD
jgi:CrcB protein